MSLSDAWENKVLDAMLGDNHSSVFPDTVYIGLSTSTPGDDGSGFTEPSSGAYARVAVPNNSAYWPAASGSQKKNGLGILFPVATGSWGTVTYVGVFEAASGGVPGLTGLLGSPLAVVATQTPTFPANSLVITGD